MTAGMSEERKAALFYLLCVSFVQVQGLSVVGRTKGANYLKTELRNVTTESQDSLTWQTLLLFRDLGKQGEGCWGEGICLKV